MSLLGDLADRRRCGTDCPVELDRRIDDLLSGFLLTSSATFDRPARLPA
jgi:hypothetical protein